MQNGLKYWSNIYSE